MNLTEYIVHCVTDSANEHEIEITNLKSACDFIINKRLVPEYGHLLKQNNTVLGRTCDKYKVISIIKEYLMGIPFNFDFQYIDIIEAGYSLNLLPVVLKSLDEKERDLFEYEFCRIWWDMLAKAIYTGYINNSDCNTVSATLSNSDLYYSTIPHKLNCLDKEFDIGDKVIYKPYEIEIESTVCGVRFNSNKNKWEYMLNNNSNLTYPTNIKESKYFCNYS